MSVAAFQRARRADDSRGSTGGNAAPTLAAVKLALRIDEDDLDPMLMRQIAAGTERANRQAASAPIATAHEAVIRFVGHLYEGAAGEEVSPTGVWRRSGAEGLLSPWTIRRAGAIG